MIKKIIKKDFWLELLSRLLYQLSFLLSPPFCVSCKVFLHKRVPLCVSCQGDIKKIVSSDLIITSRYHAKVFALSDYSGIVRTLIMAKHAGQRLAGKQLGFLIAEHCLCDWTLYDYCIPVPLHWTRYAARGFNQAALIADVIYHRYGIPVSKKVVRRVKTAYQARLERNKRFSNVVNAFYISEKDKQEYANKHLVIIDDLMTTGSTLVALGKVLAHCNPASITVVVAARVV